MGEYSKLYDPKEQENVGWTDLQVDNISSGFTWYKVSLVYICYELPSTH